MHSHAGAWERGIAIYSHALTWEHNDVNKGYFISTEKAIVHQHK